MAKNIKNHRKSRTMPRPNRFLYQSPNRILPGIKRARTGHSPAIVCLTKDLRVGRKNKMPGHDLKNKQAQAPASNKNDPTNVAMLWLL